jgi:hypothetical protein
MISPQTLPLAQLVDALPTWGWYALFAGGMLAPFVGLMIALATKTITSRKRTAVLTFYALSFPLGGMVLEGTQSPAAVCPFIILMPVGIILGLAVLVRRDPAQEPRGFEVQPKRDDKVG